MVIKVICIVLFLLCVAYLINIPSALAVSIVDITAPNDLKVTFTDQTGSGTDTEKAASIVFGVTSATITAPPDGTTVDVNESLTGEVGIEGKGSGTVTGQWLVDDAVYQPLSATMTDGLATATVALPTGVVGTHAFQVKITAPNAVNSDVITYEVVVAVHYPPQVTDVNPNSGQQDDTLDITIFGDNFDPVGGVSVKFSGKGIKVNWADAKSHTEIKANITIAPDAALGSRDITVTNIASGLSGIGHGLFFVHEPIDDYLDDVVCCPGKGVESFFVMMGIIGICLLVLRIKNKE